uniref:TSA: Wollemia nobilis Ref_Wollemi_Transcript_9402_2063 transcribed RNA sequence n=1 Tax=Wollemia nobilis TaxID=56998 RepID=A0A0C9RWA2_9CONI
MKQLLQMRFRLASMERKWILPLALCSLMSLVLLIVALNVGGISNQNTLSSILSTLSWRDMLGQSQKPVFVESQVARPSPPAPVGPPRLAYLISGSKGDGEKLKRTLSALYHPLNQYIVHLDRESPPKERLDLANYVRSHPTFVEVGNVYVITKANLVTYKGPTMVSNTLHAAAILLRNKDWDWFINLSASDYPLVTQDDLLHTFSTFPKDLNFIEHTSQLGWKEHHRAKPIIIDPGLYMSKKSDIYWATEKRQTPTAFKLFTGSAWMALSHAFVEYCIWGWDNLPRTVLMYYANFVSSPEGYFHTVICNAREFQNTTVNHDLHYISWDNPPKQHPHILGMNDFIKMNSSNAPFARKFPGDDPVLDKIDAELLGRQHGSFTPGGWCAGHKENGSDPCSVIGNRNVLKPGKGAKRLGVLMKGLLAPETFRANQCK